jgi:hypothetical protein
VRRGTSGYEIDLSVAVRRPPEAVFALLADVQDVEPVPRRAHVEMVKEPTGPTRVGTRWHERVRLLPGCWLSIESVVTELRGPGLLGLEFRSRPWSGHLTYEVSPGPDGGSLLRHRETLRVRRPLGPLTRLVGRTLESHIRERLRDLKLVLEDGAAPPLDQ